MGLAMAGRKRSEGKRTPSGQLSREGRAAAEAVNPTLHRELKDAMILKIQDPLWRSQIGQLFLDDEITERDLEAGKRWRNLAARYQRALGTKGIKPVSFERLGASCDYDPDSPEGQELSKEERRVCDDFEAALEALYLGGHQIAFAVRLLCEDDCVLTPPLKAAAKCGLQKLCEHWGLTKPETKRRK